MRDCFLKCDSEMAFKHELKKTACKNPYCWHCKNYRYLLNLLNRIHFHCCIDNIYKNYYGGQIISHR